MLKTSGSTDSTTRPGKGKVGVGSDGVDEEGHDDEHSPQCLKRVHQRTHQLSWPRLWLSVIELIDSDGCSGDFDRKTSSSTDSSNGVAQIVVELMRLMLVVVLVASRSKIRQKVEESSKKSKRPQKSKRFAKAIGSEECLPKHQSSVNWKQRTRASVTAFWQFFELFLLGPGALSKLRLERLLSRHS